MVQCPMKPPGSTEAQEFSQQLESVRKDVECFFGILKGRFKILNSSILYQDEHFVTNIFSTCCVLHNILHGWDGLGDLQDEDWAGVDGDPEDGAGDMSEGLGLDQGGDDGDEATPQDHLAFTSSGRSR